MLNALKRLSMVCLDTGGCKTPSESWYEPVTVVTVIDLTVSLFSVYPKPGWFMAISDISDLDLTSTFL
jgi:hypothetical protein